MAKNEFPPGHKVQVGNRTTTLRQFTLDAIAARKTLNEYTRNLRLPRKRQARIETALDKLNSLRWHLDSQTAIDNAALVVARIEERGAKNVAFLDIYYYTH
jgi:hypothetical protein